MTQAAQEIADLDFVLAADGQTITLRKIVNGIVTASVDCKAFVRGYAPNELNSGITQQDSKVILSPTQIDAGEWPAAPNSPPAAVDARIPVKGDKVVIGGALKTIQAAEGILIDDVLVRIELQVRGPL